LLELVRLAEASGAIGSGKRCVVRLHLECGPIGALRLARLTAGLIPEFIMYSSAYPEGIPAVRGIHSKRHGKGAACSHFRFSLCDCADAVVMAA
jgi:hypothetical protein